MDFLDRVLRCGDCSKEFVFTAGEQLFFFDKQFKNDPKRCKLCKSKRQGGGTEKLGSLTASKAILRTETRTLCSTCGIDTTVPFRPTQGRPVLCRECFQKRQSPLAASSEAERRVQSAAQMNLATAQLLAGNGDRQTSVPLELVAAAVQN